MTSRATQDPAESTATLTVRVPLAIRRRGGRKLVVAPAAPAPAEARRTEKRSDEDPLVTAVARAWRWQRLIDNRTYASVSDLAAAEGVDRSYAGKVMRLLLLAPDLIEAILDGTHPETMTLDRLFRAIPKGWQGQRGAFLAPSRSTR